MSDTVGWHRLLWQMARHVCGPRRACEWEVAQRFDRDRGYHLPPRLRAEKFRRAMRETFKVQLHVNSHDGIVFSYEPLQVRSLDDAREQAWLLRRDNRWGGADRWPLVTIHNDRGEWFPESRDCVIPQPDGSYAAWEGR